MTVSTRASRTERALMRSFRPAAALAASAACVISLAACGAPDPAPAPSMTTTSSTTTSKKTTSSPTPTPQAASPTTLWSRENLRGAPGMPPSRYFEPPVSPQSPAPPNTRCLSYTPPTGSATDNVITLGVVSCAEANEVIFDFMFGAGRRPHSQARVRGWDCSRTSRRDTPEVRCSSRLNVIRAIPRAR